MLRRLAPAILSSSHQLSKASKISLIFRLDELKDMQKKRFEYRNNLMKGQEGQFSQFTMPNGSNIQPGVVNQSSSG